MSLNFTLSSSDPLSSPQSIALFVLASLLLISLATIVIMTVFGWRVLIDFPNAAITLQRGPNVLWNAIHQERWQDALDLLATSSRKAYKTRRPGNDGLLCLHMLCWLGIGRQNESDEDGDDISSNSSSDGNSEDGWNENGQEESWSKSEAERKKQLFQKLLEALIVAYPGAARRKDNLWGWTPLHMACYSGRSSIDTVQTILSANPSACSVRDEQRLVPLHRACLMASHDVADIVRALLVVDPTQVHSEIRNGERDVPFHLVVARIHHEIQKDRFKPLRMQQEHNIQFLRRLSSGTSLTGDEEDEKRECAWPFHDPHPMLEKLIDATFLILEAETTGSIGNRHLTKQRKVELLNGCLRHCRSPNHRLFAYMALWEHPEFAMMSMNSSQCNHNGDDHGLMLHVAAGHAKHHIADCHWCAACNRGLADPHFVSQDNGESCDLTCAYRKCSGVGHDSGEEHGDGGSAERRSSWYMKHKDRMYKDVVLTIPYGCILKQIANLYPQAAEAKTKEGNLPLHLAIGNGHTWIPGVQAIYKCYPVAGRVRDIKTGLYPFQMAAAKKPGPEDDDEWDRKRYLSELTTAFELLRADPDVILKMR